MASGGGKRGSKKTLNPSDLASELSKLKLENQKLKTKLKQHLEEGDEILTPTAKQAMITNISSSLTRLAAKKIEERVVDATKGATTKKEMEAAMASLSMRLSLSTADLGERSSGSSREKPGASSTSVPKTRARSKSRTRATKD